MKKQEFDFNQFEVLNRDQLKKISGGSHSEMYPCAHEGQQCTPFPGPGGVYVPCCDEFNNRCASAWPESFYVCVPF